MLCKNKIMNQKKKKLSDGRFPFSYNLPCFSHTDLCYILPSALLSSILLQICNQDLSVQEGDLEPTGSELPF